MNRDNCRPEANSNSHTPRASTVSNVKPLCGSLYLTARIFAVQLECLVDTGATLSVVHPSYFNRISRCHRVILEPYHGQLRAADGGLMPSAGRVLLPVQFKNQQELWHKFVIAEIESPMVLGLDFLQAHKAVVDTTNASLQLMGHSHVCHD